MIILGSKVAVVHLLLPNLDNPVTTQATATGVTISCDEDSETEIELEKLIKHEEAQSTTDKLPQFQLGELTSKY